MGAGTALQRVTVAGVVSTEATLSGEIGTIAVGPGASLWMTILNPGEIDSVQLSVAGFRTASSDGNVYDLGGDVSFGSLISLGIHPAAPVVGISSTSGGYRLVARDGGIFAFGSAGFYGSLPGLGVSPARPIVGMASTPSGAGYWLVGSDGGIFAFGNAGYHGSLPGLGVSPAHPIVAMVPTPSGSGYWLVGSDGGIFAFGNAGYHGSLPGLGVSPAHPIVGMASTPTGLGYWLVGSDGGIFAFGDAVGFGSAPGSGGAPAPVVGSSPHPTPAVTGWPRRQGWISTSAMHRPWARPRRQQAWWASAAESRPGVPAVAQSESAGGGRGTARNCPGTNTATCRHNGGLLDSAATDENHDTNGGTRPFGRADRHVPRCTGRPDRIVGAERRSRTQRLYLIQTSSRSARLRRSERPVPADRHILREPAVEECDPLDHAAIIEGPSGTSRALWRPGVEQLETGPNPEGRSGDRSIDGRLESAADRLPCPFVAR